MVNRGKKQPGDGQGTIRRFGNGYDRARTSLKIAPAQALTTAPRSRRRLGSAWAPRREDNQAEADQQCHDPGDEYCTGLPREPEDEQRLSAFVAEKVAHSGNAAALVDAPNTGWSGTACYARVGRQASSASSTRRGLWRTVARLPT